MTYTNMTNSICSAAVVLTDDVVFASLNVTGNVNITNTLSMDSSSDWIYFGNGGGLFWNSTTSCIVGPDGNVSKAICDVN